jgi:uncharacterized protein YndB with AHSA1/START domain
MSHAPDDEATLVIRRHIRAPAEQLFSYWTDPKHLTQWWGPSGVSCDSATIELRVGGAYRIANRFPDGNVLWISGIFEVVVPPRQLVYTWRLGSGDMPASAVDERVSVTFTPVGDATEILLVHERIADRNARAGHARGWQECLDGLAELAASMDAPL